MQTGPHKGLVWPHVTVHAVCLHPTFVCVGAHGARCFLAAVLLRAGQGQPRAGGAGLSVARRAEAGRRGALCPASGSWGAELAREKGAFALAPTALRASGAQPSPALPTAAGRVSWCASGQACQPVEKLGSVDRPGALLRSSRGRGYPDPGGGAAGGRGWTPAQLCPLAQCPPAVPGQASVSSSVEWKVAGGLCPPGPCVQGSSGVVSALG